MQLLLDTHAFLWYATADERLPVAHKQAISDPANVIYLSVVSTWEAVIKQSQGKLPLPGPAALYVPKQRDLHRMLPLTIDDGTMRELARLPALHRDPFDRVLIAQALQHGLVLATVDPLIAGYPVAILPR